MKQLLLRLLIACVFTGFFGSVNAQSQGSAITEKQLTGTWKVVQVISLAEPQDPSVHKQMASLKNALQKSRLMLRADHGFQWLLPFPDLSIPNGRWTFSSGLLSVRESGGKQAGLLMEFRPERTAKGMVFHTAEMPFELLLQKVGE